jgi:hypothetical protein
MKVKREYGTHGNNRRDGSFSVLFRLFHVLSSEKLKTEN